jgi:hypothetical protein
MKNKKVWTGVGIIVAGVAVGMWIYKSIKKTENKVAKRAASMDEFNPEVLDEELGETEPTPSPSVTTESDVTEEKTNLTQEIFESCVENSIAPEESFKATDFWPTTGSEDRVHIVEREYRGNKIVDLLFEVPHTALGDPRDPRTSRDYNIKDFSRVIKGEYKEGRQVSEGIVGDLSNEIINGLGFSVKQDHSSPLFETMIEGYYLTNGKIQEKDGSIEPTGWIQRIPKEDYQSSAFREGFNLQKKRKVTEYVYDLQNALSAGKEVRMTETDDGVFDVKVIDSFAAIRVSFWVQDGPGQIGVNAKSGLALIDWIYKNLVINVDVPGRTTKEWRYNKFLFHVPDTVGTYESQVYSYVIDPEDGKFETLKVNILGEEIDA